MISKKEYLTTVASLQRMKEGCLLEGDLDIEYFDQLLQKILMGKQWLDPVLAMQAKESVDFIQQEIRIRLRNLLEEGKDIPTLKKAKSVYNSFDIQRPILGFDRNV